MADRFLPASSAPHSIISYNAVLEIFIVCAAEQASMPLGDWGKCHPFFQKLGDLAGQFCSGRFVLLKQEQCERWRT